METKEIIKKIDLPFTDGIHRRKVQLQECSLSLHEKHLDYCCIAIYETDDRNDLEGIWTEVKTNYRWTRMKDAIRSVEMYFDNPADKWMVCIEFNGVGDPAGWLFENAKSAHGVYKHLVSYWLL